MSDAITLVEWLAGGILAVGTAAIGHIHVRIGRMEDETRRDADANMVRVWDAIDAMRDRMLTVATKEDLRDMERRVMDAIARGRE